MRAPGEGCVALRATATSKAAAAKCRPRRHQSRSAIGSKHRRYRRLRSHRWPSPADGWLKALDFTGQGVGRRSDGAIFRRRLRHDRPQHRSTSRWPPPRSGNIAATGWKAKKKIKGFLGSSGVWSVRLRFFGTTKLFCPPEDSLKLVATPMERRKRVV